MISQLLKPECRVRNISARGLDLSCPEALQICNKCIPMYTKYVKPYPAATETVKTTIRKSVRSNNSSNLARVQDAMVLTSVAFVLMAGRVVSLAHHQHKAAEQNACPKARPDQCPDGEAWFLLALQREFRLQAHGVRCVH